MIEREIFTAASLIEDRELRANFLATVCRGDAELERRVLRLLQAGGRAEELIERPQQALKQLAAGGDFEPVPHESSGEKIQPAKDHLSKIGLLSPGSMLGPYQILQVLGEGGMGVVYAAKQSEPVKRQVALKVLRPSDASRNILARFEQERHALAMMDHQGIARILDAGTTPAGLPYFVMELVKGIPINQYCDQENLSPQERLQLFIPVCAAVQHAHQKGIIHRDLKPSNILVGLYDGKPVPKVIDFGVAKAVGLQLSESTIYTEVGSIVGTLEYMSPEQAELNNLDIDTRADIYSLGVLLYELLTGSPPFSRQQLRSAAFNEMIRMIREVDPPKPSTKVSSIEEIASIAAHRKLEPKQLARTLSGDLDWVVMKALAKERTQRYQTVNELSADIDRFLNVQPVSAGPPSFVYRAKRFLKRNKTLSLTTATTLLAIIGGGVAATLGYLESNRQFEIAQQAAAEQRAARTLAETRLKQVEGGIDVLYNIFNQLNPAVVSGNSGELREAMVGQLKRASQQILHDDLGDSLTVARLQYKLAQALMKLGAPDAAIHALQPAEANFRAHLGDENRDLLNCLEVRAMCLRRLGKLKESLELTLTILPQKQKVLGPANLDTIATINNLALTYEDLGERQKAIEQYQKAVELLEKHVGVDAPFTLTAANNLALNRLKMGDIKNSLVALEKVLEKRKRVLGSSHPDTIKSMESVVLALRLDGKLKQALPIMEEALMLARTQFGADHPETMQAVSNLAMVLKDLGEDAKAVPFLEQVERFRRMRLGADHPATLSAIANLAVAYNESGRIDEALPLYVESLEKRQRILGVEHADTLTSMNNLGTMYLKLEKYEEALKLLEECLERRTKTLGKDDPAVGVSLLNLARVYQESGRLEDAVRLYRESLAQRQRSFADDHPRVLAAMQSLAIPLRRMRKFDEAIELIETALERGQQLDGGLPQEMKYLPEMLAEVYSEAGRLDEAEKTTRLIVEDYQAQLGQTAPRTLLAQLNLGKILLQSGKLADAEAVLRENLDLRVEASPNDWQTFMTRGVLGALLTRKKQFGEAEVLLKSCYEGLQARATTMAPELRKARIEQAQKWLSDLYRATDRPEDADKLDSKESRTPQFN